MDQQQRDPARTLDWLCGVGNPFTIARNNLPNFKLSPIEGEVALAAAAILENYPFSTEEIDLSALPLDSLFVGMLDKLWGWAPGVRALRWEQEQFLHGEAFSGAVQASRIAFRNYGPIRPWRAP